MSYRPSRSEPTTGPLLCSRYPATTTSAVRSCLILYITRVSGRYGRSSGLATIPSSPAPSYRSNQSRASSMSVVDGARSTGAEAPERAAVRTARRSTCGVLNREVSSTARMSKAIRLAGVLSASIRTRESAGWMRSLSRSKSSRPSCAMTSSPSMTQRGGRFSRTASAISGK
ncbi:hypothetical protein SCYAM73S_08267 [Streptomyces cyaneofuscatus]